MARKRSPAADLGSVVRVMSFTPPGDPAPSQQDPDHWEADYQEGRAVKPPHSFSAALACLIASPRLAKLVRTFARNTVGLGWFFEPKQVLGKDEQIPQDAAVEAEDAALTAFFESCNPDMSFTEVAERVAIDREATGNGYYEVTRTNGGDISGIYHIGAEDIRIIPDGSRVGGFVQVLGEVDKVYFRRFGDTRIMDKTTGVFGGEEVPYTLRATELIHRKVYTPGSYWYGQPRWLPNSPGININQQAEAWNLNFVANNASWPIAVIIENAELGPESAKELKDMIEKKGKGPNGAGKVMVLQAQKKHPAHRGADSRIKIEKLAMGTNDDGSFLKLLHKNEDALRESFGVAELFLGSANDLNRASASVSRQVTNEQEFAPQTAAEEFAIQNTIVKDIVARNKKGAVPLNAFRFRKPKMTDHLQDSQILTRLGVDTVCDVEEIRDFIQKMVPDLLLKKRTDESKNISPVEAQQNASALNTAIAASSKEAVQPTALLEKYRIKRSLEGLRDSLEDLMAEVENLKE